MDTGRGDFAAGVQAVNFGTGPGVDQYAPAHVMCGRDHGNPFLRDVDTGVEALRVDVREVALDIFRRTAGEVDEHVRLAEALHFAVDGAGDDIAGRERMERVHLVHEFFTLVVLEDAAETADGFRNQEGLLELGRVKAGRVELHELDVLQGGPGTGGNRHAVATAVGRADGVLPDAACATGRKDGRLRVDVFHFAGFLVDDLCADATLCLAGSFYDEVLDVAVFEVVDVLLLVEFAEQRAHDFFTGEVRGMQDAVVAVSAFEVQVELVFLGGGRCELDAPLDELLDGGRTALGEDLHLFLFAESCTGFEGVRDMEFEFVCFFGNGSDSALCVVR